MARFFLLALTFLLLAGFTPTDANFGALKKEAGVVVSVTDTTLELDGNRVYTTSNVRYLVEVGDSMTVVVDMLRAQVHGWVVTFTGQFAGRWIVRVDTDRIADKVIRTGYVYDISVQSPFMAGVRINPETNPKEAELLAKKERGDEVTMSGLLRKENWDWILYPWEDPVVPDSPHPDAGVYLP